MRVDPGNQGVPEVEHELLAGLAGKRRQGCPPVLHLVDLSKEQRLWVQGYSPGVMGRRGCLGVGYGLENIKEVSDTSPAPSRDQHA